ncbi:Signal transduction histidine kinase [Pseudomonas syringae pv. actinidiae]|uniref:Signal transduction histidine kinase n=1 Tax=Pseudomonas syringae pv. actinidiae TaxID=103796 RepID=A0A2V0QK40_PSESF|nr:Signal transduction histidine kinase [Pseudomonas syringae pv. actinidiae]
MPATISTMFRLKRRFDGFGGRTELIEHGLEHVIVEQAQPAITDLQGNMAIAKVIRRARQLERAAASDMHELLGPCANTHDSAVLCPQKFAIAQRRLTALQEQPYVFVFCTEAAQATFAARFEV